MCATFRESGIEKRGSEMSDQERGKHVKATDEDEGGEVEAHKHGHRDADISTDDDSNDVEAHKHGHRDADAGSDDSDDVEAHKLGHKDS
jgi:hypothetical protein